jgi:hypothetical protein
VLVLTILALIVAAYAVGSRRYFPAD